MIRTVSLIIKPYDESDKEDMIRILTNETIKKTFVIPDFKSYEEAECMFNKLTAYSYSDEHYEKGIYLDGLLIGFVNDVEITDKCIEIGYVIHPDHHNKGYATEALAAVISDLFDKGYTTVEAVAFEDNIASRRVMEKCGMKLTDKTCTMSHDGRLQTCVYYETESMLRYRIISLADNPVYIDRAIDWFSLKWYIDRKEYENSMADCISRKNRLPQWYMALDQFDNIIGGCGLIQNDFVNRTDLYPYLCALFVEKEARGHALGGKLLNHARAEAAKLGFDKVYLCTNHTSYYERYGWEYFANGHHHDGDVSRIYKADTKI